jgi:hypothetical protein
LISDRDNTTNMFGFDFTTGTPIVEEVTAFMVAPLREIAASLLI